MNVMTNEVKCDGSNNTQDDINKCIMKVDITISKPKEKTLEYPNKPGLWKYYCAENNYVADYAAICEQYNNSNSNKHILVVHTDFCSDKSKSFSDGLTNCSLEFVG